MNFSSKILTKNVMSVNRTNHRFSKTVYWLIDNIHYCLLFIMIVFICQCSIIETCSILVRCLFFHRMKKISWKFFYDVTGTHTWRWFLIRFLFNHHIVIVRFALIVKMIHTFFWASIIIIMNCPRNTNSPFCGFIWQVKTKNNYLLDCYLITKNNLLWAKNDKMRLFFVLFFFPLYFNHFTFYWQILYREKIISNETGLRS